MTRRFRRIGKFYVYIVECSDGTYYTGYTPSIKKRLRLHNAGKGAKYTRDRKPVRLVWRRKYRYFKNAFMEEKRIKKLTRAQKTELVNGRHRARNSGRISRKKRLDVFRMRGTSRSM